MIPKIFTIGIFPINSFGLMMVCCFIGAARRLALSLESEGEKAELAEPMIFWAAVGGLLGARLWYVATFSEQFISHPLDIIFSGAGFIFYGGFVGGIVALCLFLRNKDVSIVRYADLSGPALALGYAIGRVGCHLSGDGDYGSVSTLPWALSYRLGVVPTELGVTVHPTPLYESFVSLAICWVLLECRKRKFLMGNGQSFGLYLVLTALERFWVEFLRIEPRVAGFLTQAQIFAIVIALIGLTCVFRKGSAQAAST